MTAERLWTVIGAMPRLAVAVSGGVDSMTLAHAVYRLGTGDHQIIHAVSPAVPQAATALVQHHARQHGWRLTLLDAGELADDRYRANPVNRCYFCKSNLYDRIRQITDWPIASGTNTDDLSDFRPGLAAAAERGVCHPFVLAGVDKNTIRGLARDWGLADLSELPAQPCLSSRIETGIAIDPRDLAFIEAVEGGLMVWLPPHVPVRCRITHGGVFIELSDEASNRERLESIAADFCATQNRPYLGIRPYRRGAAFLRGLR
jgi:uncharacterized protein